MSPEPQISILIDWDYLLSGGKSELHGYHDYASPVKPHGHHSCLLEPSSQDSSSPEEGRQQVTLTVPLFLGRISGQ